MGSRLRIAAAVSAGVFSAGLSHAAVVYRTVAMAGGAYTGTGNFGVAGGQAETFFNFSSPSINSAGNTAFSGNDSFAGQTSSASGTNPADTGVLFSEGSGTLTVITRQNLSAPSNVNGSGQSGVFANFNAVATPGTPNLNSLGQVTTFATLKTAVAGANYVDNRTGTAFNTSGAAASNNNTGIYSNQSGNLALVLLKNDSAGSVTITDPFSATGTAAAPVVNSGTSTYIAFAALTKNDTSDGILSNRSSGTLGFVARNGSSAFDASGNAISGVSFTSPSGTFGFTSPVVNAAGQTAFKATLTGTGITTGSTTTSNSNAIYSEGGGLLHLVAQGGQQIPGGAAFAGVVFNNGGLVATPDLNNGGQTTFISTLLGTGITTTGATANNSGVFSEGGGTFHLVAQKGSQAAGTPNGVVYTSFLGQSVINDVGQVVFESALGNLSSGAGGVVTATSGLTVANNSALFQETPGGAGVSLIARAGNAAPGTNDVFGTIPSTGLEKNASGDILFTVPLLYNNGTTYAADGSAAYTYDPISGLTLIAKTTGTGSPGTTIVDSSGVNHTVTAIGSFLSSGGEDGRAESFNDSEQVALNLTFSDTIPNSTVADSGIYVASVPEPTSVALLAVAAGGMLARRRRVAGA